MFTSIPSDATRIGPKTPLIPSLSKHELDRANQKIQAKSKPVSTQIASVRSLSKRRAEISDIVSSAPGRMQQRPQRALCTQSC